MSGGGVAAQNIGAYRVGQVVGAVTATLETAQTRPPTRYSEDELIADMLNAAKFARDPREREILRGTEGLGTARTRAEVLQTLLRRGYVSSTKRGRRHELVSSAFARDIVRHLPDCLTSVATTARWEQAFALIEKGSATREQVIERLGLLLQQVVGEAKALHEAGTFKSGGGNQFNGNSGAFGGASVKGRSMR